MSPATLDIWEIFVDDLVGTPPMQILNPYAFQEVFPRVISVLGESNGLLLQIRSADPDWFEELNFIQNDLLPHRRRYALLDKADDDYPSPTVGRLIFEWPLDALDQVVANWFISPTIAIEGYLVSNAADIADIAACYFRHTNPDFATELIKVVDFAFAVWQDHDGMTVFSRPERMIHRRIERL